MIELELLALGVLIITTVSTAQAESQQIVGVSVGVINSPYKQYDRDVYSIPVVIYGGDSVWFHGLGGDYYLWSDAADKLSIMAYYDPTHFRSGNSGSHALCQLDKCKSSLMADLPYVHNTQYGFLRTVLTGDTPGSSSGFAWDLAWLYRYISSGLILTPGIGVQYSSENYNDYYYDVSNHESRRNGLKNYNVDDRWDPCLELTTSYNLIGNWNAYGTSHYVRLSDEVEDSPMVDKSWSGVFSVGATYKS